MSGGIAIGASTGKKPNTEPSAPGNFISDTINQLMSASQGTSSDTSKYGHLIGDAYPSQDEMGNTWVGVRGPYGDPVHFDPERHVVMFDDSGKSRVYARYNQSNQGRTDQQQNTEEGRTAQLSHLANFAGNAINPEHMAERAIVKAAPTVAEQTEKAFAAPAPTVPVGTPANRNGIVIYHGSPHDFPGEPGHPLGRFRDDKIGTGEGLQVYGHGHYQAEAEGVADSYRNQLSDPSSKVLYDGREVDPNSFEHQILKDVAKRGKDAAGEFLYDLFKENGADLAADEPTANSVRKFLDDVDPAKIKMGGGKVYKSAISADPEHFLDWDMPMNKQHQHVQDAINANRDVLKNYGIHTTEYTRGSDIVNALQEVLKPDEFKNYLKSIGIKGVKYLDQDSRPAADAMQWLDTDKQGLSNLQQALKRKPGDPEITQMIANTQKRIAEYETALAKPQSRNFVVFDPADIKILKKYGPEGLGLPKHDNISSELPNAANSFYTNGKAPGAAANANDVPGIPSVVEAKPKPFSNPPDQPFKSNWNSTGFLDNDDSRYVTRHTSAYNNLISARGTPVDQFSEHLGTVTLPNGQQVTLVRNMNREVAGWVPARDYLGPRPEFDAQRPWLQSGWDQAGDDWYKIGTVKGDKNGAVEHVVVSPQFRKMGLARELLYTARDKLGMDPFKAKDLSEDGAALLNKLREDSLAANAGTPKVTIGGSERSINQAALSRANSLPDSPVLVFDSRNSTGHVGVFPTTEEAQKFIASHPDAKYLDYGTPRDLEQLNPSGPQSDAYAMQRLRQANTANNNSKVTSPVAEQTARAFGFANPADRFVTEGVPAEAANRNGIKVYHGSPHDFASEPGHPLGQFRDDKIGTGEGAQVYGHGHYQAEKEGVGMSYRDALSGRTVEYEGKPFELGANVNDPVERAKQDAAFHMMYGDGPAKEALDKAEHMQRTFAQSFGNMGLTDEARKYNDAADKIAAINPDSFKISTGHMYQSVIKDDPEHFLDWDAPMSLQSEHVLSRLEPQWRDLPKTTGETFMDRMGKQFKPHELTKYLLGKGIKGVRFFDQDSRTKSFLAKQDLEATQSALAGWDKRVKDIQEEIDLNRDNPQMLPRFFAVREFDLQQAIENRDRVAKTYADMQKGGHLTRNYVVFDPETIKIIKKYGWAGLGLPGLGAMAGQKQQQQ